MKSYYRVGSIAIAFAIIIGLLTGCGSSIPADILDASAQPTMSTDHSEELSTTEYGIPSSAETFVVRCGTMSTK